MFEALKQRLDRWTPEEDALIIEARSLSSPVKYATIAGLLGRGQDAVRNRYWMIKGPKRPWWEGMRLGFMDIETGGFDANWHYALTWALLLDDGTVLSDQIKQSEVLSGSFDNRIVASCIDAMKKNCDIVVTYYGDGFDWPYLRARADAMGINFFAYGEMWTWDLYWTIRSKYKISSKSLDSICAHLDIEGKSHINPKVWMRARVGNKKALAEVIDHNKADVIILEELFQKVKKYTAWSRRSV